MSKKSKALAFEESFERALKAAKPERNTARSNATRELLDQPRRFIGEAQVDLRWKDFRTDGAGKERPWYVAKIAIGRLAHKVSLGAPADWKKRWKTPLDDGLINEIVQAAIRCALNEEDDDIPDEVTAAVKAATKSALNPDGTYAVRKTI